MTKKNTTKQAPQAPAPTELTDEQKAAAAAEAGVASFDELTDEQKEAALDAVIAAATAAAKKGATKARMLVDHEHEGVKLAVNRVVSGRVDVIAQLVTAGVADDHASAVAYALTLNKEVVSL